MKRRQLKKMIKVFSNRFDYYSKGKFEYVVKCTKHLAQHNLIKFDL